jgi:hypothetical protein
MVCGKVSLTRRHDRCACGWSGYLADDYLGLGNSLSVGVRRLACLSASGSSFAVATRHLFEYCGLEIHADTVRRHCEKEARAMGIWLDEQEVVAEAFAKAEGEAEFQTDAGKVNTTTGWRDLKVASFGRRPLGASARLEDWKTRQLPKPTVQFLVAAIAPIEKFIPQVEKQIDRLTVAVATASTTASAVLSATTADATADVTADTKLEAIKKTPKYESVLDEAWAWGTWDVHCLGDGASWIWRASAELFEQPLETLDAFHAAETIAKYTRRQYGESTETKKARYERGITLLLRDGAAGMRQFETEERQLLDATRNPSGNDLSATTMMVTLLMSCALTVPPAPAEVASAEVDAPAPTTPNVPSARQDENAHSGLDEDDSELAALETALNSKTPERRIDGLSRYFAKHANRLSYADCLREGRAIGSGMIEGNNKTITLRLKARGARWLLSNVTAMSRLCCLSHGTFWTDYWKCPA